MSCSWSWHYDKRTVDWECSSSVCKQLAAPTKSSRTVQQGLHVQLRLRRCDCSSKQCLEPHASPRHPHGRCSTLSQIPCSPAVSRERLPTPVVCSSAVETSLQSHAPKVVVAGTPDIAELGTELRYHVNEICSMRSQLGPKSAHTSVDYSCRTQTVGHHAGRAEEVCKCASSSTTQKNKKTQQHKRNNTCTIVPHAKHSSEQTLEHIHDQESHCKLKNEKKTLNHVRITPVS